MSAVLVMSDSGMDPPHPQPRDDVTSLVGPALELYVEPVTLKVALIVGAQDITNLFVDLARLNRFLYHAILQPVECTSVFDESFHHLLMVAPK